MRRRAYFLSLPVAALFAAAPAQAVDWYVSPSATATSGCTTRDTPCSLASAASGAVAGDTVYLTSGSYREPLVVANTGTESAPITFKADACATPIIERLTSTDDDQTNGVHSDTGEYLVFDGLVVRGWSIGFGNRWADGTNSTEVSNGHWTIKHCISYSNGRTGFTFFSAPNFTLSHSIAAHNGSSPLHSWSSGVTLYEATGTNLVEGVVSFENTDEQKHTDGSGFIVDQGSNGATFINDLAFGNSGSCLRLTKSLGTIFVNNTCYHDSQFGSVAIGPTNPSELYFTDDPTIENVNFRNNLIVGTGLAPAGARAIEGQPTMGWTSNAVSTGAADFFNQPDGENPDFTLPDGADPLGVQATADGSVPATDIGFDPKCIVKRAPQMFGNVAALSRWQYDIDIDYVTRRGGVEKCFNPGARSTKLSVGAYNYGPVLLTASCTPAPVGTGVPSAGSAGADSGAAGSSAIAGAAPGGSAGTSSAAPAKHADGAGCGCGIASERVSCLPAVLAWLGTVTFGWLRRRRARA